MWRILRKSARPEPPPRPAPQRGRRGGACFWCGCWTSRRQLTRDHVVPRGVGGPDRDDNIVPACSACNLERGKVVDVHETVRILRKDLGPPGMVLPQPLLRRVRRLLETLAVIGPLVDKWREIETAKLGHSPTAAIDLTPPLVRNNRRVQ